MKKEDIDFSHIKLTSAFVLHASIGDIQKVNEFLNSLEDLRVVYQKCSTNKLYIREEKKAGE